MASREFTFPEANAPRTTAPVLSCCEGLVNLNSFCTVVMHSFDRVWKVYLLPAANTRNSVIVFKYRQYILEFFKNIDRTYKAPGLPLILLFKEE